MNKTIRSRIPLIIGVLLICPSIGISVLDPTYVTWISSTSNISNVTQPAPPLFMTVNPSLPIIEGTTTQITVTDFDGNPISNANVTIALGNGTIITSQTTDTFGIVNFEYPGLFVAVSVNHLHSTFVKFVGEIPSYYWITFILGICGFIIILGYLWHWRNYTGEKESLVTPTMISKIIHDDNETDFIEIKTMIDTDSEDGKAEFIRDMIALANRSLIDRQRGLLVVGSNLGGISEQSNFLDDADYQSMVNSRLLQKIQFVFEPVECDDASYGVFIILPKGTKPIISKKWVGIDNRDIFQDGMCWLREGKKKVLLNSAQYTNLAQEISDSI